MAAGGLRGWGPGGSGRCRCGGRSAVVRLHTNWTSRMAAEAAGQGDRTTARHCSLARTIARMPARMAAGRRGHAFATAARLGSAEWLGTSLCTSLVESAFSSGFSDLDSGLQIRHRRFDSDRSLSANSPCKPAETSGFAGVFCWLAGAAAGETMAQPARGPWLAFYPQPARWPGMREFCLWTIAFLPRGCTKAIRFPRCISAPLYSCRKRGRVIHCNTWKQPSISGCHLI